MMALNNSNFIVLMDSACQKFRSRHSGDRSSLLYDIWGLSWDDSINWTWKSGARRLCLQDGFLIPMSGIQAGLAEKQNKPGLWTGSPHVSSPAGKIPRVF